MSVPLPLLHTHEIPVTDSSRTRIEDAPTFFGDGSLASMPPPKLTGKGVRSVVKVLDDRVL
jgi:hypothetical protein